MLQAIKDFVLSWFIPLFTALRDVFTPIKSEDPSTQTSVKETLSEEEQRTRKLYDEATNPKCSYRIFHIRVTQLRWTVKKALNTPDQNNLLEVDGHFYTLREIYDMAKDPKVNYNTFYMRIARSKWSLDKALNTPVKPKVK